jgi:hypothetical protein
LRKQKKRLGQDPKRLIADAGYGSEENFAYLENKRITAVVKYPLLRKEQSKKWQEDPWRSDNGEYHEDENYYVCPNGRKVTCRGVKKRKNILRVGDNQRNIYMRVLYILPEEAAL